MTYTNPIILCDYSDPDVIRVGDTFFMTASSFNFTPGLPILTSHDLVHWELVNYAAREIPLAGYELPQNAHGLWAPSIRYHEGEFFIFVGTPDEGLFYTRTRNPYGAWSPLTPVWRGKGFEDPCPLWDDDGRLYVVHAYVKSRIGFNSKLGLLELDPKTMEVMGSDSGADHIIFDGTKTQPTIEGPKFYKRNGWYYIFAPAGGVTQGWQTVLRSRTITGPYEERICLAQGSSPVNGPHQGGLVDTPNGENWFIHFQDRGIFGRICHLQPLVWGSDDWPRMGSAARDEALTPGALPQKGDISLTPGAVPCGQDSSATPAAIPAPGQPLLEYTLPDCSLPEGFEPVHFDSPSSVIEKAARAIEGVALEWQWSANGRDDFARLTKPHTIELAVLNASKSERTGSPAPSKTVPSPSTTPGPTITDASPTERDPSPESEIPALWKSANVLTQKISSENFTFEADFDFSAMKTGSRSGMIFLGDDYASLAIECRTEGFALVYLESENPGGDDTRFERIIERIPLSPSDVKAIRITLSFSATSPTGGTASFTVDAPGFPASWHSPEYQTKNAHWVGGRFGVYAVGHNQGAVTIQSNLF